MTSSPEPNKGTSKSDSNSHSHHLTATLSNQLPLQMSPQQKTELPFNKLQSHEQDVENLLMDGQEPSAREPLMPRRQWRGISLRVKAAALAIALSTVPVLVIGVTTYFLANKKITEDTFDKQQAYVVNIASTLNRFTLEHYRDIQQLSQLGILNDPRERAVTSAREKEAVLAQYINNQADYHSIAVADLSGHLILHAGLGKVPANFSKIDYFQAALRTNRPVIVPPRLSVIPGQGYSIFVAAPVIDTVTGKTIGVVRTQTLVQSLTGTFQLEAIELGKTIKGFNFYEDLVLNQNGKVVVATAAKYTNQNL